MSGNNRRSAGSRLKSRGLLAVGHDALNGAHGAAGIGGALGHFFRIESAV
jgi:hypothetical protein